MPILVCLCWQEKKYHSNSIPGLKIQLSEHCVEVKINHYNSYWYLCIVNMLLGCFGNVKIITVHGVCV